MTKRLLVSTSVGVLGLAALLVLPWPRGTPSQAAPPAAPTQAPNDFNRQILPLLSEHCFACHGPDQSKRKAKLRLDTKEGAFGELRDGGHAIVPGKLDQSELIARITATEPEQVMPPPGKGKKLSAAQVALLKRWVELGAPWSVHWSYVAPVKPAVPALKDSWVRDPIDAFILARLQKEGLRPQPEAGKTTLLRRVTLDLTGLPPTPEEVDAFLADNSPDAYEKVVDRLLQSPRFGEHWARLWLDVARYGDTHGLHLDNYREIWPYRDWVINAFNRNMRFDQFLVEQLAGDLLPDATLDQVVATGFCRCHVTTSEGGSIEEEVYVRNVVDRVDTFGTAFLGLSVGCARCHDHKYDPVKTKEYYQLFAFFNSIDGKPLDGNAARHPPVVRVASAEQREQLARLQGKVDEVKRKIAKQLAQVKYEEPPQVKEPAGSQPSEHVWIDDGLPPGSTVVQGGGINKPWSFVEKPVKPFSGKKVLRHKATDLSQNVLHPVEPGLVVGKGDKLFAHVWLDPANPPREIMLQWHTDTWRHRAYWGEDAIPFGNAGTTERLSLGPLPEKGKWVRLEVDAEKVGIKPGMTIVGWAFTQHGGTVYWDKSGLLTQTPQSGQQADSLAAWLKKVQSANGAGLPKPVADAVKVAPNRRNQAQNKLLREYFLEYVWSKTRATFAPLNKELAAAEKALADLDKQLPSTLVFKELAQPRPAYILKRGEYDQRGDKVERGTPAFLPPLPAQLPRNRLGLARWVVSRDNPLTARVAVNRFWQNLFGAGLVKTTEDFGVQGEAPSHFKLLDFFAVQFQEEGWDTKRLLRRMVLSSTYRQSSRVTAEALAKDPSNRLLARGPRYRMDAEILRDQALFVSGLLQPKIGGPSVKVPQPGGLWEAVAYTGSNTARFTPDTGPEKVHRRSLYTFWKRTSPPPQMSALDAPSRESCTVRRERTNTPLQALLLLNEPQFVESARVLAERSMREGSPSPETRIRSLFKRAVGRAPDEREVQELVSAYQDFLAAYSKDPTAAQKLIGVGETKPDSKLNPGELAALTMIANLVFNLDEMLNKG